VDEIPELPVIVEELPAEPTPPPATAGSLTRDALFDLIAALCTGFGVILVGALAAALLLMLTGGDPRDVMELATSPWGIAAMLLATQLPLLYFALRRRRRNREKQRPLADLFAGGALNTVPIGICAGFGLTLLSAVYSATVQRVFGENSVQNQVEFLQQILDNKLAVALLVFIIAGLAPVCEELFFRGVIFGSARAAGLRNVGVLVSALLFATVHLSPLLFPFYATFGVVMCWLYARTGTLAAPIAAHMTMNGVACAVLLLANNRV
jgi:membrane protease YdiL (CAAX protease family)